MPRMTGQTTDTKKSAGYQSELDTSLHKIENIFPYDAPFLAGAEISTAICLKSVNCSSQSQWATMQVGARPRLNACAKKVHDRLQPQFDEADAPNAPIYKVKEMFTALSAKL